MIRLILGLPDSGKTLTAVKFIKECNTPVYTNLDVKLPNAIRLKWDHIIKDNKINWEFWRTQIKKHGNFSLVIDEIHNVMHARRSQSKSNVHLSIFFAQIRKVCGDHEKSHFIAISQELERIDISVRDIASEIVVCEKAQYNNLVPTTVLQENKTVTRLVPTNIIRLTWFNGGRVLQRYNDWRDMGSKTFNYRTVYAGNDLIKHYDSYTLIDFGNESYI